LDAARAGDINFFTTAFLLAELEDVLSRKKFAERLASAGVVVRDLVLGYAALASVIEPAEIEPVILADPDDDAVLACAVAAHSEVIVSGDSHLLDLKHYQDIRIVPAAALVGEIS
jgi:putative PIN family toxin of toxin-antitoxin system